jgi:hypothetical protein
MSSIPFSRDFQEVPLVFNEVYVKDLWPLEFMTEIEFKGSEEYPCRVEVWADTGSGMKLIKRRETRVWDIDTFTFTIGEGTFSIELRQVLGDSTLISALAAYPQ